MLTGEEIRQTLYSVIKHIGKEKIQADIISNTNSSQKYITDIIRKCTLKLRPQEYNDDEILVTLCEALLHFMLTISTLPSERKIQFNNNIYLDVVIPNLQNLKKKPEKSLIVAIVKNKDDMDKLSQLESLQPTHENIWLISYRLVSTNYRTYSVFPIGQQHNFSKIIIDVDEFLRHTGDKSFRFIS
jgi:hypothetical protein